MKKYHISTLAVAAFIVCACTLTQKQIARTALDAPRPDLAMAHRAKVSLSTLETGWGVYMRKCGECHAHIMPDEVSSKDWHVVVPGMAWNAGIEPSEEKALLKYLIAAKETQKMNQAKETSKKN